MFSGEKDAGALLVKCGNSCVRDTSTCSWTGELGDMKYHRLTCLQQSLLCPQKCRVAGKAVMITRKYLQLHVEEECGNRSYTCPHCREQGTFLERTEAHMETCPQLPIACPNSPCPAHVARERLERHKKVECLHAEEKCCHSAVGCSAQLKRKALMEHEADMSLHLETAKATIIMLRGRMEHEADVSLHLETAKATITMLRGSVRELKEDMGKLETKTKRELVSAVDQAHMTSKFQTTFKIANFTAHQSVEYKSAPFYTQQHGYKLCVIVEPNGVSKARGAYVSVYTHLMRGEYDDNLAWPLVGTVTFELLNQLGDHDHRKQTCTFPPDDKDNHRVTQQEIAGTGYGCPKFISHAKLAGLHDLAKDVQYLKDDAIYVRVAVDAPEPLGRDWLRCY